MAGVDLGEAGSRIARAFGLLSHLDFSSGESSSTQAAGPQIDKSEAKDTNRSSVAGSAGVDEDASSKSVGEQE